VGVGEYIPLNERVDTPQVVLMKLSGGAGLGIIEKEKRGASWETVNGGSRGCSVRKGKKEGM